jgi:hypothetical protein
VVGKLDQAYLGGLLTTVEMEEGGRALTMSSRRSPIRSRARTAVAWSSEPVRRALITRAISSALGDIDSRLSSFMRSALLTPSATSKRQGRSSSRHRVHRGLVPSHCTRFSGWPRAHGKQSVTAYLGFAASTLQAGDCNGLAPLLCIWRRTLLLLSGLV